MATIDGIERGLADARAGRLVPHQKAMTRLDSTIIARSAFAVEDLTEDQVAAIRKARVPKRYKHLDAELEDWKP